MEKNQWKLSGLGVLAVFALMAICVLMVLLAGAEGYRAIVDREERTFDSRTAAQYLTTRIRQSDRTGTVAVEDFGGTEALSLREQIGGKGYVTRIYCHDGWMWELFTPETGDFSPEDGEKLLELEALSFRLEGGMLTAGLTMADGSSQTLTLWLRSGKEASP